VPLKTIEGDGWRAAIPDGLIAKGRRSRLLEWVRELSRTRPEDGIGSEVEPIVAAFELV
jgi:hypothetical protein